LPVFVITPADKKQSLRRVHLGWVEDWDDDSRQFLVTFGDKPPKIASSEVENMPFDFEARPTGKRRLVSSRDSQQRFKFAVLKRYGPRCALCDLSILPALDAAHIRSKKEHGSDDPRNGLVFCAVHHRLYDEELFAIEPKTTAIHYRNGGPDDKTLRITRCS